MAHWGAKKELETRFTQATAADGFFSLGMLAEFAEPIRRHGDWFYRALFWEAGLVGQVLYLEAKAWGAAPDRRPAPGGLDL
jgi:hypothetical protein